MEINSRYIIQILRRAAGEYPSELINTQVRDISRIAFNIGLAVSGFKTDPKEFTIADFGGGIGLFSLGCAALGFKRVILIDDFMDSVNEKVGDAIFEIHRRYGVEVISRDVIKNGFDTSMGPLDIATCFDSMEHWPHSPKNLFREIKMALKSKGRFVLGAPNCVNLRKRIWSVLGRNKWSSMQEWYENEKFRGHIREPDVDDLLYIARDIGLADVRIYGRNWLGYCSAHRTIRAATILLDHALRLTPTLCSDIYMVGVKP